MQDEILIFNTKIAKELMQNRFLTLDMRSNKKMQGATVFAFEDTTELRKYLKTKHNISICK